MSTVKPNSIRTHLVKQKFRVERLTLVLSLTSHDCENIEFYLDEELDCAAIVNQDAGSFKSFTAASGKAAFESLKVEASLGRLEYDLYWKLREYGIRADSILFTNQFESIREGWVEDGVDPIKSLLRNLEVFDSIVCSPIKYIPTQNLASMVAMWREGGDAIHQAEDSVIEPFMLEGTIIKIDRVFGAIQTQLDTTVVPVLRRENQPGALVYSIIVPAALEALRCNLCERYELVTGRTLPGSVAIPNPDREESFKILTSSMAQAVLGNVATRSQPSKLALVV